MTRLVGSVMLVAVVGTTAFGQGPALTGRWRVDPESREAGPMGRRGESVASVPGAHALPRTRLAAASLDELRIDEGVEAVTLEVTAAGTTQRQVLPVTGVAVLVRPAAGEAIASRAERDDTTLVVTSDQRVVLPGGEATLVQTVQRHTVLADGRLQVDTTRSAGTVTQTSRALYTRVK